MMKKTVWFLFLSALAFSCLDEPDCFSLNNNLIGISFKKLVDGKADTIFFSSVTADGTDSVFVENSLVTGIDKLPLNYYTDQTVFHFSGLNGSYDLHLGYSAKTQLVSEDCGERFVLTNMKALEHTFDSLRQLSTTPKRNDGTGAQFEVYRCPNRSQVKLKFTSEVSIAAISTDYQTNILYSDAPVSTIRIPLNILATSSTINFEFTDGTTRSITIGYVIGQETLFSVCGEQYIISDINVMSTDFSSPNVIRSTTQDPPQTNIEISL
jgi:hypothetical protein